MPDASQAGVDIGDTFGSALIGLLVASILFGITILQTWTYFSRSARKDTSLTRSLVGALFFLDTMHWIFCVRTVYWYLITNYNNPDALDETIWSMNIQTDFNGLIGLFVEFFFARRVWMMSGNLFLTGLIMVLASLHFGLGVVFTVKGFKLGRYSLYSELTWVTCTGLGSAAAADLIIAGAMVYYLLKSRTGFPRTDNMLMALILYSINTGLVTSIVASVAVITFAIMPTNFVWLSCFWVLGKCYVNSFLAILNGREAIRSQAANESGAGFLHLSGLQSTQDDMSTGRVLTANSISSKLSRPPLEVSVSRTTDYKSDYRSNPNSPAASTYHIGSAGTTLPRSQQTLSPLPEASDESAERIRPESPIVISRSPTAARHRTFF